MVRSSGRGGDVTMAMTREMNLPAALVAFLAVVGCSTSGAESTGTERAAVGGTCVADSDCAGSYAAQQVGRCGPDVVCDQGTCRAECLGTCDAAIAEGCPAGSLCTASASPSPDFRTASVCTKRVLHCTSADQCPIQVPGDGTWTCESGVCRFPGHVYPYE